MNVDPNATLTQEEAADAAPTNESELVEVGAVSATQGSVYGPKPDTGVGLIFS